MSLPLTSNEIDLINKMDQDIKEIISNVKSELDTVQSTDPNTTNEERDESLKRAGNLMKQMNERSKQRSNIFSNALNRLKP